MKKSISRSAQFLILAITATSALTGCGQDTLDWRNTEINNGKIFAGDSNSPFNGKVTNAPYVSVFGMQNGIATMLSAFEIFHLKVKIGVGAEVCDAAVKNGDLNGDVVCKIPQSDTTIVKATFSDGRLNGQYKIYTRDGKYVFLSANFKDGFPDGQETIVDGRTQTQTFSANWSQGKLDGAVKGWSPSDGSPTISANYNNGVLTGDYFAIIGDNEYKGAVSEGKLTGTDTIRMTSRLIPRIDTYPIVEKIVDGVIENQDEVAQIRQIQFKMSDCMAHNDSLQTIGTDARAYQSMINQCKSQIDQEISSSQQSASNSTNAEIPQQANQQSTINEGDDNQKAQVNSRRDAYIQRAMLSSNNPSMSIPEYKEAFSCAIDAMKQGIANDPEGFAAQCLGNSANPSNRQLSAFKQAMVDWNSAHQ